MSTRKHLLSPQHDTELLDLAFQRHRAVNMQSAHWVQATQVQLYVRMHCVTVTTLNRRAQHAKVPSNQTATMLSAWSRS